MKYEDLPERWKLKLKNYLESKGEMNRIKLNAYDFNCEKKAIVKFEDGSFAEFFYPLVIEAPEFNEIGLFTEHCGYHIFNIHGTHIDLVNKKKSVKSVSYL